MEGIALREPSCEKLDQGYSSQWELMGDLFAWLDLRIYLFYKHHQWLGPKNEMRNMLGLVVSREEFEHHLAKAAQVGLASQLDGDETAWAAGSGAAIRARLARTQEGFPLLDLFRRCGLDEFGQSCVVFAYAVSLDKKYEKLLAYLQDDITQKAPMTTLAVQLFLPPERTVEEYLSRFSRRDAFTGLFDPARLAAGQLVLMVMNYYYQAMEDEFTSYLFFTLRSFVFYLAFSLLLGRLGPQWFWWLYPCTEAATLIALLLYGKKRGSLTMLDNRDDRVFSALLYSRTADLGQVEQDVAAYMEQMETSPTQTYYASIVVEEVCGAIMNNAFSSEDGYIQFTIVPHEDKTVTIHVRDSAKKFNPFDLDTDSIDLDRDAGLDAIGIKMIKSKAKEFFYRRYAGFNTLVVRV